MGVASGSKQYSHAVADFIVGKFFKSERSMGSLQSSVSAGGLTEQSVPPSFRAAPYKGMPCSQLL